MCKSNYFNRILVIYTVGEQMRQGVIKCGICNGPLSVHGCYCRHILDEDGKRRDGWIAQGCCAACKKYPAIIPDFIMPYKHYEAAVIESAISKVEEEGLRLSECPADECTIRRWASQFHERGTRAAGALQSILFRVQGRHVSILDIYNKGLLKQLDYLARVIQGKQTGGVIGRVNAILTIYNSGYL